MFCSDTQSGQGTFVPIITESETIKRPVYGTCTLKQTELRFFPIFANDIKINSNRKIQHASGSPL
jgi:hypothetical protein